MRRGPGKVWHRSRCRRAARSLPSDGEDAPSFGRNDGVRSGVSDAKRAVAARVCKVSGSTPAAPL